MNNDKDGIDIPWYKNKRNIVLLIIAGLILWPLLPIIVPVVAIYYLWKTDRVSKIWKKRISYSVGGVLLVGWAMLIITNQQVKKESGLAIAEAQQYLENNDLNSAISAVADIDYFESEELHEELVRVSEDSFIVSKAMNLSIEQLENEDLNLELSEIPEVNNYLNNKLRNYVSENRERLVAKRKEFLAAEKKRQELAKVKAAEEARTKELSSQFNPWNGSHYNLTEVIKSSMKDPSSYKHVETSYSDKGDYLIVQTTFRGTNSFGGVVTNTVTAEVDTATGLVLEILSE